MKYKLLFIFLCVSVCAFSQSEIYFYKDTTGNLLLDQVKKKEFNLLKEPILDSYSSDVYWFKIPKHPTKSAYIFTFLYERINHAEVYQKSKQLKAKKNQRFLSYQFSRESDVYVKIDPELHAYLPVQLKTIVEVNLSEKHNLLLNGFYYGFVFLVIIYNLFYYFFFKDDAFLFYALFLFSVAFGVFTMDGMLNFYNINKNVNDLLMLLNYLCLAFFSSKFVNSYLFLDTYYPRIKIVSYIVGVFMVVLALLYFYVKNFYFLLLLNIFVFSFLLFYWGCTVFLFKKNVYTKILSIAYVMVLFSAVDFFVLNFLGISFFNSNATTIKVGAFIEMIILSVAVLYRMKVLKEENEFMKNEIVSYSKVTNSLNTANSKEDLIRSLSIREREIFDLVTKGYTNKQIASKVNISINTVKFHIKNIYEKLNIKSRKEAYNWVSS